MWVQSAINLFDGVYAIAEATTSLANDQNKQPVWLYSGGSSSQFAAGRASIFTVNLKLVRLWPLSDDGRPLRDDEAPTNGEAILSLDQPIESVFGRDWTQRFFRYTARFHSPPLGLYADLSPVTFFDEVLRLVEEEMPGGFEPAEKPLDLPTRSD